MPTDLNPLVRRAVQLGCDTFRAEWQDFEVEPNYDLDTSFGQVPLVGQDFSEALVNLVSNACYAMRYKRESSGGDGYEPQLKVSSRLVNGMVEVRVRDNGTGIPDDVVGHIFNPFFTTREGAMEPDSVCPSPPTLPGALAETSRWIPNPASTQSSL